jgi:hypothetical protein
MTAPYPVGYLGEGITRVVALAVPSSDARRLLPTGLELAPQDVTPPGTHPAIFQFHDFSRCRLSIPTLLPDLAYHEQTFAIPYTCLTSGSGPFAFMPQLYLDHSFVTVAGFAFWGFWKTMARISLGAGNYTVAGLDGRLLASLSWNTGEERGLASADTFPHLTPVRRMLSQPIVTMLPASAGPFFALTDFTRNWSAAMVRPLGTKLQVEPDYARGFYGGRYPGAGWSPGIDESTLGSFELRSPWWLSFPYPPLSSR